MSASTEDRAIIPTADRATEVRRAPLARAPRSWQVVLGLGLAATGCYYLLPAGTVVPATLLTVVNASGAVFAIRTATRVPRGDGRVMWLALGAAMTLATLANVPYYAYPIATGRPVPFPCPVDAFWLGTYPCFAIALAAMARQRRVGDRRGDTLDATILIVGCGLLMWDFIIAPVVRTPMPLLAHVVAVAYPTGDLAVFAFLVRYIVAGSRRNGAGQLLLASFVALLASDTVYALELAKGTYGVGGSTDGMWMASYLLIGVAALHPSARNPRPRVTPDKNRMSFGRITFLSAAVLTGPIVVAFHRDELYTAASVSAVLFLLVMARVTSLNHELAAASRELQTRATTDSLTGLANRAAFRERLHAEFADPDRRGASLAILFVDLDDFKDVNDTLGHAAGDALLTVVADRLRANARPADVVARLGGDEFALLLHDVSDPAAGLLTAERVVAELAEPADVHGTRVHVGASVGLAIRSSAVDPDDLMREADVAMYAAKASGKSRATCYDPAIDSAARDYAALRTDLEHVTERDELVIDYQPFVEFESGRVIGVEALVRWQHPTRGLLPPSSFIPLAETTGAIVDIGSFVLERACREAASWQHRHGLPRLSLSVNVSARQLSNSFDNHVLEVLHRTGLAPDTLILEITESVLIEPTSAITAMLRRLRQNGVRIALDDFGTGYASIGYLRQLDVDVLKIDRSFVSGDQPGEQADALLEGIIGLAQRLGLEIIPEGIEETAQLARLQTLGCHAGQGFLLSPPVSAAAINTRLTRDVPVPGPRRALDDLATDGTLR